MVIIHGGGMIAGSGEYNFALAPILNAEGIVLVTLNYRLGSLGFFAHPQLDGSQGVNFGLMDMLASLRWINRNIAVFGGDPKQVTVVGVSAGAMSVNMLMANPASAGLIAGGIAQSGYGTWPLQPRTKQVTPLANAPSAEAIAMELASQATGKPSDRVTRKDLYAVTAEQWTSTRAGLPPSDYRWYQSVRGKWRALCVGETTSGAVYQWRNKFRWQRLRHIGS